MAEGGFDDYNDFEMKEREQQERQEEQERQEAEQAEREQAEQETNFDDDDVVVDLGDDRTDDNVRVNLDLDDLLDDIGKDTPNVRRVTTNSTKKVFKNIFDITLEKKNG